MGAHVPGEPSVVLHPDVPTIGAWGGGAHRENFPVVRGKWAARVAARGRYSSASRTGRLCSARRSGHGRVFLHRTPKDRPCRVVVGGYFFTIPPRDRRRTALPEGVERSCYERGAGDTKNTSRLRTGARSRRNARPPRCYPGRSREEGWRRKRFTAWRSGWRRANSPRRASCHCARRRSDPRFGSSSRSPSRHSACR